MATKEQHRRKNNICGDCGVIICDDSKYCRICTHKHHESGRGFKVHATKIKNGSYLPIGYEKTRKNGYVMVKVKNGQPGEDRKNGDDNYEAKHRLVMKQIIGRNLTSREHVHHIDGVRSNNAPENLFLISAKNHAKLNHFLSMLNSSDIPLKHMLVDTLKQRYPSIFN